MAVPAMAAGRLAPRTHAITLTMNAMGGARNIASPPRAVMGEPHPGLAVSISTRATGAASESHSPARPDNPPEGLGMTGGTFGRS